MTIKLGFFNKLNRVHFNKKYKNKDINGHLFYGPIVSSNDYPLVIRESCRTNDYIIENVTVLNVIICIMLVILFYKNR